VRPHLSFLVLSAHCALTMSLLTVASACGIAVAADAGQASAAVSASVTAPLRHHDGSVTLSDPHAAPAAADHVNLHGIGVRSEHKRLFEPLKTGYRK
jgi:hypothetical protein